MHEESSTRESAYTPLWTVTLTLLTVVWVAAPLYLVAMASASWLPFVGDDATGEAEAVRMARQGALIAVLLPLPGLGVAVYYRRRLATVWFTLCLCLGVMFALVVALFTQ